MVRISDARMSGTSYGTIVLHCCPDAAGGPLSILQNGDAIRLDLSQRQLDVLIGGDELVKRLANWSPLDSPHLRGYPRLYMDHVLQCDEGCDLDFLRPRNTAELRFVLPIVGRS